MNDRPDSVEPEFNVAIDPVLKKPCCVILQAAYGCGARARAFVQQIDSRFWLLHPTDDIQIFRMTPSLGRKFADQCNAYHRGRTP